MDEKHSQHSQHNESLNNNPLKLSFFFITQAEMSFHSNTHWGSILPAVSNLLAARSPLLVAPAVRTNSPPVFTLSGVNLEQETGAMQPH